MPKNPYLIYPVIKMRLHQIIIGRSSHVRRSGCSFSISCFSYTLSSLDYVDMA